MTEADDTAQPEERPRRAFLRLPEGYFDLSEADQLAALEPFVDALLDGQP